MATTTVGVVAFVVCALTLAGCDSGETQRRTTTTTPGTTSTTTRWTNWDGVHSCGAIAVHRPRTQEEVVEFVKSAVARGKSLKVFGSGHSYSKVAACDDGGEMMSLALMNRTVGTVDTDKKTITVQPGKRLREIYLELESHNLAFPSVGNIMAQTVAGAISTATHGCNSHVGSLSSAVIGLRLVLANGTVLNVDGALLNGDVLMATRASLGALGVITEVTLQAVPTYKLRTLEDKHEDSEDYFRSHLETAKANPYTHLFFYNNGEDEHINRVMVKGQEFCDDDEDDCKIWYEAQTRTDTPDGADQLIKTYEMEMNVDAAQAPAVVAAFRNFLADKEDEVDNRVDWSFSARYVGAEETWLAPAYNRPSGFSLHLTLLMHCRNVAEGGFFWTYAGVSNFAAKYGFESPPPVAGETLTEDHLQHLRTKGVDPEVIEEDFGKGFMVPCLTPWVQRHLQIFGVGLEHIAYAHGGRPHFGKENHVTAEYLKEAYPRFTDFVNMRNEFDPTGVFMSKHLEQRLVIPSGIAVV